MDAAQLEQWIALLRRYGGEEAKIEAKRAETELPKDVVESLCAFANTPGGGVLLLGVDEASHFAVTGVANPSKIQEELAGAARDRLTPPLQPDIGITEIEGKFVVWAEVEELQRAEKPCYVTAKGINRGSYVRVGGSDRRLTTEEVQQLIADRGQPRFDHEIVEEASVDDLDPEGVQLLLSRVRANRPWIFAAKEDHAVLQMLGVLRPDSEGVLRPTLAGILALGQYPQQFFPQLCLTFVRYPTKTGGDPETSIRFLDNARIDGSIPVMVREALSAIQRNMSRRALIKGVGRQDVWEYPVEALREAIVNALVHRDLSPGSRGFHVQIEMYPDRLRIVNPGGLYGVVDITRLGEEGISSARNSRLMMLLEDVAIPGERRTVCENRGSGILTMRNELIRAGMSPPEFRDRVTSFEVVMPNHTLFDEDTVRWLGLLGGELKDTQRTALAFLRRRNEMLDNARYRMVTGISDSRVATSELQDLVARELVEQIGTRRGARYILSDYAKSVGNASVSRGVRPNRRRQIVDLLLVRGELSKAEIAALLNVNAKTVEYWLRILKKEGMVEASHPAPRAKNTRYRVTNAAQYSLFD